MRCVAGRVGLSVRIALKIFVDELFVSLAADMHARPMVSLHSPSKTRSPFMVGGRMGCLRFVSYALACTDVFFPFNSGGRMETEFNTCTHPLRLAATRTRAPFFRRRRKDKEGRPVPSVEGSVYVHRFAGNIGTTT